MLSTFFYLFAVAATALGATYNRASNIAGDGFNKAFEYQAIPDPTQGRVNYVDKATAQKSNLTFASDAHFVLRADDVTTLTPSGPGRNSVRLRSTAKYETHVAVFNIRHMPEGCGTWPAVWETDESVWPNGGEVDILEGVNNVSPNAATLHTSAGCSMPDARTQLGKVKQASCDSSLNGNAGCGVAMNQPNSYGPGFNKNGGGFYAIERTKTFIKVWFWPRGASGIPSGMSSGAQTINTDNWGTPAAYFPNTSCDIAKKFTPHNIIINLTFCGAWAGQTFNTDGCSGSCVDLVNSSPKTFANAYFDFASLNIYT